MRPAIATAAAALLLGAAITPVLTAPAAEETPVCQGQPATHVGVPGEVLTATEDPDVIVSNSARLVEAGAGADLICLTGEGSQVRLMAGAGDDDVHVSPDVRQVEGQLGAGADRYAALGATRNSLYAGDTMGDDEADVITTGSGDDDITTGQEGADNADQINLGAGNDNIEWFGVQVAPGFVRDVENTAFHDYEGDVSLDAQQGTLTVNGKLITRLGTLRYIYFANREPGGSFTYTGSSTADQLRLQTHPDSTHQVNMGRGEDVLVIDAVAQGQGTRYNGGASINDTIRVVPEEGTLQLNMPKRRMALTLDGSTATGRVIGFEHAGLAAERVTVTGDGHRNTLNVSACRSVLRGGGRGDMLSARPHAVVDIDGVVCDGDAGFTTRILGGPGNDFMYGTPGPDVLLGGRGHDQAFAHTGRDRCRAELRRGCEVR